jgi:hypothetical protein
MWNVARSPPLIITPPGARFISTVFFWKSWISVELTDSTEALERCGGCFTLSTGYSSIFFLLKINLLRFIFRVSLLFLKMIFLFPQYRKQDKNRRVGITTTSKKPVGMS